MSRNILIRSALIVVLSLAGFLVASAYNSARQDAENRARVVADMSAGCEARGGKLIYTWRDGYVCVAAIPTQPSGGKHGE